MSRKVNVGDRIEYFQSLKKNVENEKNLINELSFKYINCMDQAEEAMKLKKNPESIERQRAADKFKADMELHKLELEQTEELLNNSRGEGRRLYLSFKESKVKNYEELIKQNIKWNKLKEEFFEVICAIHNINAYFAIEHGKIARPLQDVFNFSLDEIGEPILSNVFTDGHADPALGVYDLTYQGFARGLAAMEHKRYMKAMEAGGYKGMQTTDEWLEEITIRDELIQEAKRKVESVEQANAAKEAAERFNERVVVTHKFREDEEERKATLKEEIKNKLGL